MISFEWDETKNISNIHKHNINFNEAVTTFSDDNSLMMYDPDHSVEEDRHVLIGLSNKGNVLVTIFCFRGNGEVIRIISVRKANKEEEYVYFKRSNYERSL